MKTEDSLPAQIDELDARHDQVLEQLEDLNRRLEATLAQFCGGSRQQATPQPLEL